MAVPIQRPPECPELIPSPPGANDGRSKWAEVLVLGASAGAFSVTTPSWRDDAQPESSHATTKASIPNHAAPLFTKPNLPNHRVRCKQRNSRVDAQEPARKSFAWKEKLAFSSAWPATGASLNACGTNTTGSVFFSNKTGRPKNTCSCWKRILTIRAVMKLSRAKWV